MRFKTFCILIIVGVISSSDTRSYIKDYLKSPSLANQYATAIVLPINLESKEFAKCVEEKLKNKLPYLKFFPVDKFRDAMIPWFEPNKTTKDIEELSALLNKPFIRKRVESDIVNVTK